MTRNTRSWCSGRKITNTTLPLAAFVTWDGTSLGRLDVTGLPEDLCSWSSGTFAAPVTRELNSTGGNATFDRGWFDEAHLRVVAHFPEDASLNFDLDLETLFGK